MLHTTEQIYYKKSENEITTNMRTLSKKVTLTVSEIFHNSPPRCAVANMCAISIDRNLADSETYRIASEEIREPPFVEKHIEVFHLEGRLG
jgi:hypothetical protein